MRIAVIDQGSTTTKGALYGDGAEPLVETGRPTPISVLDERIQHDPAEIAATVRSILDGLLDYGEVDAIGLTCQRSTCLVWDRATGEPLTAALSWQDTSQAAAIEALSPHGAEVARRSGLRLSPHYAAAKLQALLAEVPDGHRRAETGEVVAGTLDAFLVHSLVGRPATEGGHAGRSLLYNLDNDEWDDALCRLFDLPRAALPRLRRSATRWGDVQGVPLTAVAGDQQAALLGHGGWRPGVAAAHFGTGAFVLASVGADPERHPRLLAAVLAGTPTTRRFQLEGSINSAGSAVDWACRLTGIAIEEYEGGPLEPTRLPSVIPAFTGAAAPWWKPAARGAVLGLELDHGRQELLDGVLAGLALRVVDNLETLRSARVPIEVLRLSGKLTRLDNLVDLISDAGQVVVEVASEEETGLLGISRLAAAGLSGKDAPLRFEPAVRRRREPEWTAVHAASVREHWLQAVRRAGLA